MTNETPPQTPGRAQKCNEQITFILMNLSSDWDMNLLVPGDETPTISTDLSKKQKRCLQAVRLLIFKAKIESVYLQFQMDALALYNGWVNKPKGKADRGMPRPTIKRPRPVTNYEREMLMDCFLDIADESTKQVIEDQKTRSRGSTRTSRKLNANEINDTAIPIKLPTPKRAGEVDQSSANLFKRPRIPEGGSNTSLERERPTSNNTSFASLRNPSVAESFLSSRPPSVFENHDSQNHLTLTQETIPDDNAPNSSNYDSTPTGSFDHPVDAATFSFEVTTSFTEVFADPSATRLQENLCTVFPICDVPHLLELPLYFQYEVIRVFLHTGVTIDHNLNFPRRLDYGQYETLWAHLRRLPVMQGKPFPPKTDKAIWNLLLQDVRQRLGSRRIIMGGYLQFVSATDGPLFQLKLRHLQLDNSHRLERRFGSDRFLEIDIPNLAGYKIPKTLQKLGSVGQSILLDWLNSNHKFLGGRTWAIFSNKPIRTKDKKNRKAVEGKSDVDNSLTQRLYFFAITGGDFGPNKGTPKIGVNDSWTRNDLLNWIRPTVENKAQPCLKLYARNVLALSRNTPTVVIDWDQIIYKRDLEVAGELMTDGAGRLSNVLAQKIAICLGLDYLPSGFQARFGDAKGFWSIDPSTAVSKEQWIEVYDSQRKWKRRDVQNPDYHDPAYRTFEVNSFSAELKSADMNTQLLPILIDRAINQTEMTEVIEQLLEQNLSDTINAQRTAMMNPLTCREWIQKTNSRITEKLKAGVVPFAGGLPAQLGDRMSLLLDAGFHPVTSLLLREITQQLYIQECETLRNELKITVHRSTYAYMVPDFAGVLEHDEVYIHLSRNVGPPDAIQSRSGFPLQFVDMLVTRSPAHFQSDIQKVKAVFKPELAGLQDVIVFSTRGSPSLAQKLSGGDYDGDIAWICWEPSIVDNFANADMATQPDLVAEGYIEKLTTTYEELVADKRNDPASVFLRKALDFNLEPSLLGICTVFKENYTYANPDLSSTCSVYLSTLLSNLVDQPKQGYIFNDSHWQTFRKIVLKEVKTKKPPYKDGVIDLSSNHIMDRLKVVANRMIEKLLTEFNEGLDPASSFDGDLTRMSKWAHEEATRNSKLVPILAKLKEDIGEVKLHWGRSFAKNKAAGISKGVESRVDFSSIRDDCYERYQAIMPQGDQFVCRLLLKPPSTGFSQWDLLKASVAFDKYQKGTLVWWMAGRELCFLKASTRGLIPVAGEMHAMLKPDSRFVRLRMAGVEGRIEESSVHGEEDVASLDDIGDDEDAVILVDD